jgi:hypothetical protein
MEYSNGPKIDQKQLLCFTRLISRLAFMYVHLYCGAIRKMLKCKSIYRTVVNILTKLHNRGSVPNREESGVIRSNKMYSCVQCAMQEKSVCCRDVPCLAHMEQGPDPLHPGHLPPSLICLATGDLVY